MGSNLGSPTPSVTQDDINTAWAVVAEMQQQPSRLRCRSNEDLEIAAQALGRIVTQFTRICTIATIVE